MASVSRKRSAEEALASPPKEAKTSMQGLPNELLSTVFQYLEPADQLSAALACRRFAVVTADAMRLDIYDEDKLLILEPLLKTLPEDRQAVLREKLRAVDTFPLPEASTELQRTRKASHEAFTKISQRFQEVATQQAAHHDTRQANIVTVLQESLNIPLADAESMAATLVDCDSKEDFYESLFDLIKAKREDTSSPAVYREAVMIDHLQTMALLVKTSAASLEYVGREYIRIGLLDKAELIADKIPQDSYKDWGSKLAIIENLVSIYQQRGDLEKCIALCKSLRIGIRSNVHPQLLQIYDTYKTNSHIEGMLSALNTMSGNDSTSYYQVEKFVEDVSSLLQEDLETVLTYVRQLENEEARNTALSVLSEAYQKKSDFPAAFKTLQEITSYSCWRSKDGSSLELYEKHPALEALFTPWMESAQGNESVVQAVFYAYASQNKNSYTVTVRARQLSEAMRVTAFLAIARAFFDKGDIDTCFDALHEIPPCQDKYDFIETLYKDSMRKKDFENAYQCLLRLTVYRPNQTLEQQMLKEHLIHEFIAICLKEQALVPMMKLMQSFSGSLGDQTAAILKMIAEGVQESQLKDLDANTLQAIVDLYSDYTWRNYSLQDSHTMAEKLPEPMKSQLLANVKRQWELDNPFRSFAQSIRRGLETHCTIS
jgi:hypothetical protein